MTYRVILAVLRGDPTDSNCLSAAQLLAQPGDGHVEALHVRADPRRYIDFTGDAMTSSAYADLLDSLEEEENACARKARAAFDGWQRDSGAQLMDAPADGSGFSAAWREVTGMEERVVTEDGRLFDAIVIAATSDETESIRLGTIERALFDSGRPLLMVPSSGAMKQPKNIAVLWNGSAQAARAVESALPVLKRAETVSVLWVEDGEAEGRVQTGVAEYLAWHGITARMVPHKPDDRSFGEQLHDEAAKSGADLVVMGAYSHSRLREFILGGVTQHMLENSTLPILMAH